MKQLITTTLLVLALLLPALATAHDFEVDGIYYNINGNEATVTYKGGYETEYDNEYSGFVVIPDKVTYNRTTYSVIAIGTQAFYDCTGLTSIVIPNRVKTIGTQAFYDCTGLTSIDIPNSVITIGDRAFIGCTGLTSIVIPKSVTKIGNGVFKRCSGLTSMVVESGNSKYDSRNNCNAIIETANNKLIGGCSNTTIPNSVTKIGEDAFFDCTGLTSIVIPNSVTEIGVGAFHGCTGLTSIDIPNSLTKIGGSTFEYCAGLTSIVIPNSVTEIGDYAFYWCTGLTSIYIPKSVTAIGYDAFHGCTGLTSIVVESGNPRYDSRNNCNALIETANNRLILGCNNTIIPNSVTEIGYYAFEGCAGLTSIVIPNSVTKIGEDAFYSCTGLNSIYIPNSVTEIGYDAFHGCTGLTSIVVESGNPKYDSRNNCNALIETANNKLIVGCSNTIIPNTVTEIGSGAFYGCTGLTSISIPNSVTVIGHYAFAYCPGLTDVYCYIADLSNVTGMSGLLYLFYLKDGNYSGRTLHVLKGMDSTYKTDENWYPYFGKIVDDLKPEIPFGDVNGDFEVNIADVNAVIDIILGGDDSTSRADVNGDGEINIADINALTDHIKN